MSSKILLLGVLCLFMVNVVHGQDTVKVSLKQFVNRGVKNSKKIDAERQKVRLAQNRVRQTKSKRYLPDFELNTQHGLIPGVKSDRKDLSPNEYYLDPNLKNDFSNYSIFTRANLKAVQPIFTWGALRNAIKASRSAAVAARNKFQAQKKETKLRLYKLYQSYLLSLEVQRLLNRAQDEIDKVTKKLNEEKKKGKSNLSQSDLFKFKIFKSQFSIRAAQVKQNAQYIQRVWNYVLQAGDSTVFIPKDRFLDPVQTPIKTVGYYKSQAVSHRPEIQALNAGIRAANYGVKATQAENYPKLFAGVTANFAYTPNRPRQSNPFIINKSNYFTPAIGIGIRQNLNFFSIRYDVDKSKIKRQQAQSSKSAAIQGIVLQVNKKYKNASLSKIKIQKNHDALVTARKWVRQEELNADFNRGNPKNLIDALQKELELEVQYKQSIFNFNEDMAELYETSALPVTSLKTGYSE
ncbi:MAG TPA: TolC family protein [Balneolaceae bacterium]|nr:TolC family protein [Balneolaceae bacterium]